MSEYADFQKRLTDALAQSFRVPYSMMAHEYGLAESSAAMVARHMREQRAAADEATIRLLLGQWVSELEPVIWYSAGGQVAGIGDAVRLVIPAPLMAFAKEIYDAWLAEIRWAE